MYADVLRIGASKRYSSLFSEHLTLQQLLQTSDLRRLGTFLLDIQRHREWALQEMTSARGDLQQTRLIDFF